MTIISLPREHQARMRALLRWSWPREIGGILMGEQLAPGHFRVVDFSVDRTSGTAAHFVRSPEHHQHALDDFFERTDADYRRFNYLGEWHSHPRFSVRPSPEDVNSMTDLVHGERDITFATLMIVRLRYFLHLELCCYMFARHQPPSAVTVSD